MGSSRIKQEIEAARPPLHKIAPLTAVICHAFVWVNFALGLGLFYLLDPSALRTPLLLVNGFMTFEVWGIVFLLLGALLAHGLVSNRWEFLRKSLLLALTIKAIWAVMLLIRVFENPATVLWMAVWAFMICVQTAVYVYFYPQVTETPDDTQ